MTGQILKKVLATLWNHQPPVLALKPKLPHAFRNENAPFLEDDNPVVLKIY